MDSIEWFRSVAARKRHDDGSICESSPCYPGQSDLLASLVWPAQLSGLLAHTWGRLAVSYSNRYVDGGSTGGADRVPAADVARARPQSHDPTDPGHACPSRGVLRGPTNVRMVAGSSGPRHACLAAPGCPMHSDR